MSRKRHAFRFSASNGLSKVDSEAIPELSLPGSKAGKRHWKNDTYKPVNYVKAKKRCRADS